MIIDDEKRRKKILEKIEKVESQIVLLNDLKRKLVNGSDDLHNTSKKRENALKI